MVAADGQWIGVQAGDRNRSRRVGNVQFAAGQRDGLAGQGRIERDRAIAAVAVGLRDGLAQTRHAVGGIRGVKACCNGDGRRAEHAAVFQRLKA